MRSASWMAAIVGLALLDTGVAADNSKHVTAKLVAVGGSGVTGVVQLEQMPGGGTQISIVANGLTPGVNYLSLYYENHTCELEDYADDDVIGRYTANAAGVGQTAAKKGDDLDEINSVSVRRASDFSLVACADIHPGS
jgi:hypothetical protein